MHHGLILAAIGLASSLAAPPILSAGSHKPSDFPLRVAIFGAAGHDHSAYGSFQFAEGEGRGDLFENGQPHAIDFQYHCSKRFRASVGYETFMARWKKPRHVMELLLPEIGKPGSSSVCQLMVDVRETQAYVALPGGEAAVIPAASFKLWMDKAQYDPENGKESPLIPLRLDPSNGRPAPSRAAAQSPASTSPQ